MASRAGRRQMLAVHRSHADRAPCCLCPVTTGTCMCSAARVPGAGGLAPAVSPAHHVAQPVWAAG